jgi:hypothetical protein
LCAAKKKAAPIPWCGLCAAKKKAAPIPWCGLCAAKKKAAHEARPVYREETPRKGRDVSDASRIEFRVRRTMLQEENATRPHKSTVESDLSL